MTHFFFKAKHFLVIFRPLLSNFMQNVGNSQDNYLAKSGRTQKKNRRKRPIFLRLIEIFFSTIGIYNQRCGGRHEWLSPNVGFSGSRWQQINNPGRKKKFHFHLNGSACDEKSTRIFLFERNSRIPILSSTQISKEISFQWEFWHQFCFQNSDFFVKNGMENAF